MSNDYYTWLNSSGGDWDTAANWSGGPVGSVPNDGDAVTIDAHGNYTVTAASDVTIGGVTLYNNGVTLNFVADANGDFSTITGTLVVESGTVGFAPDSVNASNGGAGYYILGGSGEILNSGFVSFDQAALGSSFSAQTVDISPFIENSGLLLINNGMSAILDPTTYGTLKNDQFGQIDIVGDGSEGGLIAQGLTNQGTIDINNSATVLISGALQNSGSILLENNSTLDVGSLPTITGVSSPGTITFGDGSQSLLVIESTGTVSYQNNLSATIADFQPGNTIDLAGHEFFNNATVSVNNNILVVSNGSVVVGKIKLLGLTNAVSAADFTLSDDGSGKYNGNTAGGFQITTSVALAPTISNAMADQITTDHAAISPFAGVTITEQALVGQTETLTVALSSAANGVLSVLGAGSYNASTGVYTDKGSADAVTADLQGLIFTPTVGQVPAGQIVITGFTIHDTDTLSASATDSSTTVIATAAASVVAPTISGTVAGQPVIGQATIKPFASVVIADANIGQTETIAVTLSAAANGSLGTLGGGSYNATTGVYTVSGSAAAVTAALEGLVFTPAQNTTGQSVTTTFTISDTDTAGKSASNSATTVIAAAGNALTIPDNSIASILESGATITAGASDTITLTGSADVVSVSGSNTWLSIGGNGQGATDANDDRVTFTAAGTVSVSSNSRVDIAASGAIITGGTSDTIGLYGSADTVSVSGAGASLWIGGNGQNASNTNDDHITLAAGGSVTVGDNSRVDIAASGAIIAGGTLDTIGLYGSADTVSMSGAGASVWIGGNGQNASNANDDRVVLAAGGAVTVGDNSRVDIAANGAVISGGTSDAIGLYGSADTVFVSGAGTTLWIGGNGRNASDANDDHVVLTSGGAVTVGDGSRVDIAASGAIINGGSLDTIGLYGSGDTVSVSTGAVLWVGGNGQSATSANVDRISFAGSGALTVGAGSSVALTGTGITVGTGVNDTVDVGVSQGPIGFISGAQDQLGLSLTAGGQTVTGFNAANGDLIDLTSLLSGVSLTPNLSNLGSYVTVATQGADTVLSLGGYGGSDVVTLAGVTGQTLLSLENSNAFLLPAH